MIETFNLTKYYGRKTGCIDVSMNVGKGEIFGLLGPNGAGKSTLTKLMLGLIYPSDGKGLLLGKPLGDVDVRKKVGYLPENFKYNEWMTGIELLSFHASLYKIESSLRKKRIEEVLELVGLKSEGKNRIGTYSKGMQQRIGIASALLSYPEVVFLDEPTSALDPIGRKEVRDIMIRLKDEGRTIFLNSHLLSEVEMVCDSIAIIKKGRILKQDAIDNILCNDITLEIEAENISLKLIEVLKYIDMDLKWNGKKINISIDDNGKIPYIVEQMVLNGAKVYGIVPKKESLENIFINLVGEK